MKVKSIIACGLLLLGVGAATTSCEDMLTAENNLVTTNLAPQDTVYQMMGILQRMQKLADRTILLGEVRADLVEVDPIHASSDIQQLASNTISTENTYNSPAEYYSVINSCNIYLAYVDSLYKIYGDFYYEKEICATKCFRAWCYLELTKVYGEVPFVTEPVLSAEAADQIVSSSEKADMLKVLNFSIQDLAKYPYMPKNDALRPRYGNQKWNDITWNNFFIPVRALLGELYLWRGSVTGNQEDYKNAVRMYHDYFCYPGEEISTGYNPVVWATTDFNISVDDYSMMEFYVSANNAGVLPLDSVAYFGNTSDLRAVFNSQYSNNYYPAVSPSQRIRDISKAQRYCYYNYLVKADTIYASTNPNDYDNSIKVGDLRLSAVYNTESNIAEARYNGNVNSMKNFISKWTEGDMRLSTDRRQSYIPYYRNNILYLHMAEALNLAGFPETAFAVLAYGITNDVLDDRSIISQDEFDRLCEIKSYGFSLSEPLYAVDAELNGKTNSSFVIWPSNIFENIEKVGRTKQGGGYPTTTVIVNGRLQTHFQQGIHSIGSGDTEFNKYYQLNTDEVSSGITPEPEVPVYAEVPKLTKRSTHEDSLAAQAIIDANEALKVQYEADLATVQAANATYLASAPVRALRQAHVRQLILEEEALEGMFEGLRFYDLLRYQMQDGKVSGSSATITLPAFITTNYGATPKMEGKPWYLPLPKR
ncbi:MAG: RagB/SusD family nutrient uptake outer membrane protein [Bacteroidaceae bacterium]|nr:RagB/SusD family nutrient uptake outer membrane protein [Bacteroidaceae bacterium]